MTITLREHYGSLARQGIADGVRMLAGPPVPSSAMYLWALFLEAHAGRTIGGFAPGPLSWSDIDAWLRVTGRRLDRWELDAVRAMDGAFVTFCAWKSASPDRRERLEETTVKAYVQAMDEEAED